MSDNLKINVCEPEGVFSLFFSRIFEVNNIAILLETAIIGLLFFYVWQLRKDRIDLERSQMEADESASKANLRLAEALGEMKATLQALLSRR